MKSMMIPMMIGATMLAVSAAAQVTTPADFVKKAGAGDLYETTSSKLVLQTTKNPKVRSFAQMMVTDHQKSTADVKAAAGQARVAPAPPKLDTEQQQMVTQLRGQTGAARDTAYIEQQKTAHQKALALHQGYASSGSAAPLKAAAAKIAPVVQHHIDMLQAM